MKAKFVELYNRMEDAFLMLCLVSMGLSLLAQVVSRYVFKTPLIWSEEAARYLHVWIALFGINFCLRRQSHIRIAMLMDHLPPAFRHGVDIATSVLILFCIGVYLPAAYNFVADQSLIVSSAMGLNMAVVAFPAIFGFCLAFLHYLASMAKSVVLFRAALRGGVSGGTPC